jgi:uncharacterized protein YPO0396
MKKLSRMLLIHWYGYTRELIEFGNINFLTGKTAAGKSTIIDALQLVLLGDTNGNFFNKAANEKSVRTLKSYLYGETGDDGETGYRYLRKGPFTSYVVLEFEDTEKKQKNLTGIVCDCYEDQNFDYKWFTVDRFSLPENLFTDEKTNTPYNIRRLRSFLKSEAKTRHEIIETNKRFQEVILAKYGSVKRKYLVLLKKAVPFTPITDIEKFITESICDVKNNIQVEQMQSDIREYKSLEADAERTRKRIEDLTEIEALTSRYEAEKERYKEQGFVIARAELEEYRKAEAAVKESIGEGQAELEKTEDELKELGEELSSLKALIEKKEEEYHTSDLYRRQRDLEASIREKKKKIGELQAGVREALEKARHYGNIWLHGLEKLGEVKSHNDEDSSVVSELAGLEEGQLESFDFPGAAVRMGALKNSVAQCAYELAQRRGQLEEECRQLETRVDNLRKGIKPYPFQVTKLKGRLEAELFARHHRAVEINIFADMLEIRNPEWRDAIEGYLDRQKFNLLVPPEYYRDANEIYNGLKKEEKMYDTGLVDIGRLRAEFDKKPMQGSLAEEIETEDEAARLYADYLLGNVMKCEDISRLNTYRIAVTRNVMLYKNYVSRRLNPVRWADPFIGRKSMQILLENAEAELKKVRSECEAVSGRCRLAERAASLDVLSVYEAEQHQAAISRGKAVPALKEELTGLQLEYEGLDLTYLTKLRSEIDAIKGEEANKDSLKTELVGKHAGLREKLRSFREERLPEAAEKRSSMERRLAEEYDAEWIEQYGNARYQKALKDNEKAAMSLKDSFTRSRAQTMTRMENHRTERRRKRNEYNQTYRMPYDAESEDNEEYGKELKTLSDIRLPEYIDKIKDAKEKAYNQFRDDFIAKLKSNIETVRGQIEELNYSLKNSVFGTDRYRFVVGPRAEYRNYYDMITDPMLMDIGGWNISSEQFNSKYQREIDSLFKALIVNETDMSAERRVEYERNIRKFTDYKTYLVFDLLVTNEQGETQRLSRTLLKKSGGETQIPFYIALLASFSQVCRIRNKGKNNTIRLIILDEAFSKMDGERIQESITLLKRFGLQAVFSAPPEKIPDIAPNVDRNIAVYKTADHRSFTRYFDPAQIEDLDELDE